MNPEIDVVFFDTESTDLTSNWGRLLCGSFLGPEGDPVTLDRYQKGFRGRNINDDGNLADAIATRLELADVIVGWFSQRHDVPLVTTRVLKAGGRRPRLHKKDGNVVHVDLYYAARHGLRLNSNKLEKVAEFFEVDHEKTRLKGDDWNTAYTDRQSMRYVTEHCEEDVLLLRDLWPYLKQFVAQNVTLPVRDL